MDRLTVEHYPDHPVRQLPVYLLVSPEIDGFFGLFSRYTGSFNSLLIHSKKSS